MPKYNIYIYITIYYIYIFFISDIHHTHCTLHLHIAHKTIHDRYFVYYGPRKRVPRKRNNSQRNNFAQKRKHNMFGILHTYAMAMADMRIYFSNRK